jgi:hypothetical protein
VERSKEIPLVAMKIATLLEMMQVVSCIRTTTSFAFVAQNNAAARQQQSQLFETQSVVDNVTVLDNPRQTGMALMLDDGTRKSHSMAENTQFVTGFFKGLANRNSYRSLITTLYYVYKAQEEAMDNTHETCVQILDYPELRRLESLKKDMEFFYGTNVSTFLLRADIVVRAEIMKITDSVFFCLHIRNIPVAESHPTKSSSQSICGTCTGSGCNESIPPSGTSVYTIFR